uniref:Uncharacterized protein n=1 Tax=Rhizophora mucronata TaxID=61149 RepID=A0A2P2JA16_RHIMU
MQSRLHVIQIATEIGVISKAVLREIRN